MLDSTNIPLSTDLIVSYATGARSGTLFGHPVISGAALDGLLDRLDGSDRAEGLPKNLTNPRFSTSGYFPKCLGRIEGRELYLFDIRGHDGDRYHILVQERDLVESPKFFVKVPVGRTV